jgi:hypothetical protein
VGGPKTDQGKKISAQNAIKSGVYAKPRRIYNGPLAEAPGDVERFVDRIVAERAPTTLEQREVAEEIAATHLRNRRLRKATDRLLQGQLIRETFEDAARRGLIEKREIDRDTAVEFWTWLSQKPRDYLWSDDDRRWKSVTLSSGRAERFARLLHTWHTDAVWVPPRWTESKEPHTDQGWFLALRELVSILFDGSSLDLTDWLYALICQLQTINYLEDQQTLLNEDLESLREANRQLEVMERSGQVRARSGTDLTLLRLDHLYNELVSRDPSPGPTEPKRTETPVLSPPPVPGNTGVAIPFPGTDKPQA